MIKLFRKLYTNQSFIMVCLQNYQECMSLATFHRVQSNSKEIYYLPWQNKYSDLKTTCHLKPNFFLWTKLLENFLLAKYLKSVPVSLNKVCMSKYAFSRHQALKSYGLHKFNYHVLCLTLLTCLCIVDLILFYLQVLLDIIAFSLETRVVNPFSTNVLLLHPQKTSEKLRFFMFLRSIEMKNWLKMG